MKVFSLLWELLHPFQMFRRRLLASIMSLLESRLVKYRSKTSDGFVNMREFMVKAGVLTLVLSIVIWISLFLYVAFYYTYMPNIKHSRPVHFQYKSCSDKMGICSYPSAHVTLTKRHQLLMVGQAYKFTVNLEMPESEVNKKLGMFMCCVELRSRGGVLQSSSCRSGMLQYRSPLLSLIETILWSPMTLLGFHSEKQTVQLELFSSFEDDQDRPVTEVYIEVQSRFIELYSASLHIDAHFTGLRYVMFNWPYLSAAVGVSTNLLFVALICALSWYHLHPNDDGEPDEADVKPIKNESISTMTDFEDDPKKIKEELTEECQTSEDSLLEDSFGEENSSME